MSEKGLFQTVLKCKCPNCRDGSMFSHSAYDLRNFSKMPENCPVCKFRFEPEPGFFYGSMYVSYGLSVGIFITSIVLLQLLIINPTLLQYISTVSIAAILLYPLTFRYARVIFINIFGGAKYDSMNDESKSVS